MLKCHNNTIPQYNILTASKQGASNCRTGRKTSSVRSSISRVEVWNLFNFFCAILDRWWHLQGYLCSLLPNYVAVADLHTPFNSPVRHLPFSVEFSAKACGFWTSVENTKKYHFPRTLNSHFLFQQKINKVTIILTNEALYRYFCFSTFIYRCVWWTS